MSDKQQKLLIDKQQKLQSYREQHPDAQNLDDTALSVRIWEKHYAPHGMPWNEFASHLEGPMPKPAAPPAWKSAAEIAGSGAAGAVKEIASIPGIIGDLSQIGTPEGAPLPHEQGMPSGRQALDTLGNPVGAAVKAVGQYLPNSSDIREAISPYLPQADTTEEALAERVGGWLPYSVTGPAQSAKTALTKGLTATGKTVGKAGLFEGVTEGAGKIAGEIDPRLETPAEIGSAIALSKGINKGKTKPHPLGNDPTVRKSIHGGMADIIKSNLQEVKPSPAAMKSLRSRVYGKLFKMKYHPDNAGQAEVNEWLEGLQRYFPKKGKGVGSMSGLKGEMAAANPNQPGYIYNMGRGSQGYTQASFADLEDLRQGLSAMKRGKNARYAYAIEGIIDDFYLKAARDTISPRQFVQFRKEYAMKKKMEALEQITNKLELKKGRYRVTGDYAAVTDQFKELQNRLTQNTKDARLLRGTFSKKERDMIKEFASGEMSAERMARALNSRSFKNALLVVGGGSWWYGNLPAAAAAGAVGAGGHIYKKNLAARANKKYSDFLNIATGGDQLPPSKYWQAQLGGRAHRASQQEEE